jgi:radical SAM superfamily enzyme YgiQ (UPF0313 family)
MRILLIQPPIRDFYQTSIRTQPIGLAYLASSLRTHGHEVEILDCQTGRKRSVSVPPELSYLRNLYPFDDQSPFKLYSGFYHFGMGWDEIRHRIEASNADAFGISSSFTPYHGEALEIARIIKEWEKEKIVVLGGSHASSDPEGVLKSPYVDYVVLGEGEIRLPLLLEKIETGNKGEIREIDGIGYRENGEIRMNPPHRFVQDLNSLPPPARDLLDLDRYRLRRNRSTMLITSRGCPHRCAYCSAHLVMGSTFRTRSPEAIIEEMRDCRERYGIRVFDIEDDNFTFDQERAKRLLTLIIETFGEGSLELSAMNGVSFASLDKELLRIMKKAGFRTINLSLVSTGILTRERMKRPKGLIDFDRILEEAIPLGLNVIAYGIFGMPGQTIEEMVDTLIYLMGRRVLIGPSIYYPTPGTPLFERCKREKLLPSYPAQWRSSAFPIETPEFSRLDLVTLFRLTRGINFIKEKMDHGVLHEGITWRELSQIIKEKVEVKAKVEGETTPKTPCSVPNAPCPRHQDMTWEELLLMLFTERSFFSLRKEADGRMIMIKEESSRKVLDYFLDKAWDSPILRS